MASRTRCRAKGLHLWFQSQGVEETTALRGPSFDDSSLLLKAVLSGQGAGLLPAAMIATELEEGRLIRLADTALLAEFAHYLVYPEASHSRPKIATFRSWILKEAAH
ncbi:LysR substrate-binding domain-containing protein [Chelativorans alearense]|uniref:LysR substrate-binding domain-containing protein n=1 Tax=Chelativorans alearense TaxID=2681495 RepID=UPI001FE6E678|nr:LysR substrate-binding domain-containing protein [Chelativorans alearense]